jgi:hypothetical protein
VLHYYESLPFAEVAGILDLPKSTVQTRITQAVARLRRAFRRSGQAALLPCLELPSLTATPSPWIAILAMNGKQISAALVGLLVLGLGWLAIGRLANGDHSMDPVGAERAAVAVTAGSDAAATGASEPEAQRSPPPIEDRTADAMVFGRVVDAASGTPVAAAAVTLFDFATRDLHQLETDEQGRYAFPSTRGRVDVFRLAIDKRGAGRLVVPEVRPAIEARTDELQSGLVLQGRIRLASGAAPPPGCRILAMRLPFLSHEEWNRLALLLRQMVPHGLCIDRETEAAATDGAFRLSDLQAGRYVLVVLAAGRQPLVYTGQDGFDRLAGCDAAPPATAPSIEIVLPAAGAVYVEVIDGETATPILGASVTAAAEANELWLPLAPAEAEPASPHRFRVPVNLDVHGRIRSSDVQVAAPGRATIHISPGGQQDGHTFVIALDRPATVLGTVRGHDGAPIVGAPVLIQVNSDHRLAGSAHSDANGAFEIGGLGAGDGPMSLLCLRPDGTGLLTTVPLRLAAGEVRRIDIGPGVVGRLSGRVAIEGRPQPGVYVCVFGQRSRTDVRCDTVDDGAFTFAGLPPDTYEVFLNISVGGRQLYATRDVTIDTTPVHIDFDFAHRLTGTARFEGVEPGAPLPEGEIIARRVDAPDVSDRVDLGADGRFEMLLCGAATYEISFDAGIGWVTIGPPLVDLRLGTSPPVEVRVLRDACDATIELRVNDAIDGTPVTGSLFTRHRNSRGHASYDDGIYLDEAAGIGIHRFTIHSDEHRPTPVEVEVMAGQKHVIHHIRLERANGVRISEITAAAAGHRAGLRKGDQILRYGGHEIRSIAQLRAGIATGTGSVPMVVRREGIDQTLLVDAGVLGIELQNLP